MAVMESAAAAGGHPYIALVGAEDAVVFRVRRAVFGYDATYQPFPLPRVTATFWNHAQQSVDVMPGPNILSVASVASEPVSARFDSAT
jgi:hypothetical protein